MGMAEAAAAAAAVAAADESGRKDDDDGLSYETPESSPRSCLRIDAIT
jgi:hypothetical protein